MLFIKEKGLRMNPIENPRKETHFYNNRQKILMIHAEKPGSREYQDFILGNIIKLNLSLSLQI